MKNNVKELLKKALIQWSEQDQLSLAIPDDVHLERTKDASHGDFASNIAMALAKPLKQKPRVIAKAIVKHLPVTEFIEKAEIAGPGFINIYLKPDAQHAVVKRVLSAGDQYGRGNTGNGQRVMLEFVSANPTGPLHVGHGRSAAYGAALAEVMRAAGYDVQTEYYVNDAGRQMAILAASIWLRYLAHCGETFAFPSNGYKGDYVIDMAEALFADVGEEYRMPAAQLFKDLPQDFDEASKTGDKEAHIDAVIAVAKDFLGDRFNKVLQRGLTAILDDIRDDLEDFGVHMDEWFSEESLLHSDALDQTIERLEENGYLYEKDGARWFRATDFDDEKDRVVVRANGTHTYFASDLAYHANKYERGFTQIIDIFGADHHGYLARMQAGVAAMGFDPACFKVLLVQFAILYRGKERVQMSTRSGSFVTLRQLRDEVGNDAARFFYVMRKCEQHLDFDLELAKSKTNENPVYYIQYAHARVCSVMRQLAEKSLTHDINLGNEGLSGLVESEEVALLRALSRYPEVVEAAALNHEPHIIANFLRDLANDFHVYYNAHRFLDVPEALRHARINLIIAVRQVLQNGLHLLGVSAPETM